MSIKETVFAYLREQVGDDDSLLETLFDDYRTTLCDSIAQMKDALQKSDNEALRRLAHAQKGASLTVGDNETSAIALSLELAVKAGDSAACLAEFERLTARGAAVSL